MTSTMANNNSIASSQPSSYPTSNTGSTPSLPSLAKATDPNGLSPNQQQISVGSFPQRTTGGSPPNQQQTPVGSFPQITTGGSPTTNTSSPFGNSFLQTQAVRSNPALPFDNSPSTRVPAFSFTNSSPSTFDENSNQKFIFNQPPPNSSAQQPLQSFTFTSSAHKQEQPNNKSQVSSSFGTTNSLKHGSQTNEAMKSSPNNMYPITQRVSDPPTPISEQPGSLNQEQEETEAPISLAENSLLEKQLNTKLRDSHALVVDRSDPNSPLYAVKTFQDLNLKPDLLKGIYNMAFRAPSKIQEITLPHLLSSPPRNIVAQSQSGTGKTAAFSLAILSRIDPSIQSVQALILAPTYELAIQIGSVIEKMAQFLPYIQVAYAVRGSNIPGSANLARGQRLTEPIVVGTPGTVEDWCRRRRVIDLSKLRICCVDEADVMIATEGFQQTCGELVKGLNQTNCQMMLFSATYSDEVMTFAREIVQNPVVLRLKREKQALTNIRQFYIRCYDPEVKYHAIEEIYANLTIGQAMIFCRTKATARALTVRMANQQHSVRELTAALDIGQRADIIKSFREGVFRVLVSTNVTARGIDIDDVSLVINYDMPVTVNFQPDYETYLHRIGRCGRFGKLGYTFNLIGSEKDLETMRAIEQYFSHPIDEINIAAISNLEQDQE